MSQCLLRSWRDHYLDSKGFLKEKWLAIRIRVLYSFSITHCHDFEMGSLLSSDEEREREIVEWDSDEAWGQKEMMKLTPLNLLLKWRVVGVSSINFLFSSEERSSLWYIIVIKRWWSDPHARFPFDSILLLFRSSIFFLSSHFNYSSRRKEKKTLMLQSIFMLFWGKIKDEDDDDDFHFAFIFIPGCIPLSTPCFRLWLCVDAYTAHANIINYLCN